MAWMDISSDMILEDAYARSLPAGEISITRAHHVVVSFV